MSALGLSALVRRVSAVMVASLLIFDIILLAANLLANAWIKPGELFAACPHINRVDVLLIRLRCIFYMRIKALFSSFFWKVRY